MSELPKGWADTTISDITDYVQRGKGPKYAEKNSFPVVNQKAVRWFGLQEEHLKYVREDTWDKYTPERFIQVGDILWNSTGTGTIGRACLLDEAETNKAKVVDSHVTIVRPNTHIEPRYLFAWIRSPKVQHGISSLSTGTTNQVELSKSRVLETKIPLAPLNEQIRIANKLDSILAKVDKAQARLDKIPAILKRFRQSVLAAATSGELTGSKVESWQNSPLSKLLSAIADCPHSTPKWTEEGKLCVRTTAFKPFKLDLSSQGYVSEETYIQRTKRLKPLPGDILYSREGAILGIACQIPEGIELCMGQRMLVMRAANDIDAKYLTIYLNSPKVTDIVKTLTLGNAAPRINMSTIKNFDISYPTPSQQREIVEVVERLFTKANKVEKQYLEAKARLDRLTQSILAKAFRGELVPQDPTDEAADKLLERILAERELEKPRKKTTKKRVTKAKTVEKE